MKKSLYIKTFGCQMNERDSAIMARLLSSRGYVVGSHIESADMVILNTCTIRAKAEQKVYSLLGQLRQQKEDNPDLCIAVAGCVAQQDGKRVFERMKHVDIVVGTQQLYRLPELVDQVQRHPGNKVLAVDLEEHFAIPSYQRLVQQAPLPSPVADSARGFKRFVTIMQGCNNFCSYCVVPQTRGREVSRPVADILYEVESLVQEQGVVEVTLLGQNVNSYGLTNPVADGPVSFADLLRRVSAVPGLKRLRFTTSNPKDLSMELMHCFGELENLCPHIHLPVQSGSNRILGKMNRKYTVEAYLEKIDRLREIRPDIAIGTDIIVGFPGETEEDFDATIRLVETVCFHSAFSFKYSDRPNTRASLFSDKVPEEVKSKRLQRLQLLQDEISLDQNNKYIGKEVDVLVERIESDCLQGRTGSNHLVHCPCPQASSLGPGDFATVLINGAGNHSLRGEILAQPC